MPPTFFVILLITSSRGRRIPVRYAQAAAPLDRPKRRAKREERREKREEIIKRRRAMRQREEKVSKIA